MSDTTTPVSLQADAFASNAASPAAPPTRLSVRTKVLFGLGDTIDGFSTTAIATFHLFYLTIACGIPGWMAGSSAFIALLVDAFVDPYIGSLSDNLRSRYGRRHPFLFASLIPIGIGVGLTYSVPGGLSGGWIFAYITVTTLFLRISYSLFTLPFYAMGAELTSDYAERSRIVVYRTAANISAILITQALGYRVFMAGDTGLYDRAAYGRFGWTIGALLVVTGFACAYGTLSERHRMREPTGKPEPVFPRLIWEIVEVCRNRSFLILFMTVLLFWIAQGATGFLALHLAKFFWNLPNEIIQYMNFATTIGLVLGIPLSALFTRLEKRTIVIGTLVFNCSYQGLLPVLRMFDALPETGWGLYGILLAFTLVFGASGAISGIFFQSMMADAADEHELLFGTRREGLYFAGITVSLKSAIATGLLIGGFALSAIGLPEDIATNPEAVKHISGATATELGIAGGPLPAVISIASLVLLLFYRIDKTAQIRNSEALALRRREVE